MEGDSAPTTFPPFWIAWGSTKATTSLTSPLGVSRNAGGRDIRLGIDIEKAFVCPLDVGTYTLWKCTARKILAYQAARA